MLIYLGLGGNLVCAIIGGYIYRGKNRPFIRGFLWGLFLGLVGLVVTICRSSK